VLTNSQLTVDIGKTLTINGHHIIGGTVTDSGMIHVARLGQRSSTARWSMAARLRWMPPTTLTLDNVTATATVFTDTAIGAGPVGG